MPPSVSRQWFRLHGRQRSITPRQSNSKFSLRQHADFISSQEWTPHLPDLNPLDYSVWDILQELVYEGRREPFANLKDLQNVIRDKWHDVDDQTVRKAILQWKRRLAAVAKQNGGTIQQIFCWSVDWHKLLWRSLRTTNNTNDALLANIVLWCAILFRLYHG